MRIANLTPFLIVTLALPRRQTPDPTPILDHAATVYRGVTTVSADFVQIITNPMVGPPDTTRGKLYERRPGEFAMRFTAPSGDRIVADGRYLWLYTPSTTPDQVIRRRIPDTGTTGPNLIGQFVEHPHERFLARYVRADSSAGGAGIADVVALTPRDQNAPYAGARVWIARNDGLVRRIDISEAGGQERTVILSELRINGSVPAGEFRFTPPGGTRVVDQ
ncbi:MAG TPA: outer membrane lipoprotein carrier protein LolA [Gemmatimonadales bacterium]|nr:outer membrane lipoprotein carrier protein LolA [Gemmatimonadales bacterium]